jgi:hypothetical protein
MPVAAPYELTETKHGTMLVNRNDFYMGQSLLVYGECSELELMFLLTLAKNPGLVIEVGANMGMHTIPMPAHWPNKAGLFTYSNRSRSSSSSFAPTLP